MPQSMQRSACLLMMGSSAPGRPPRPQSPHPLLDGPPRPLLARRGHEPLGIGHGRLPRVRAPQAPGVRRAVRHQAALFRPRYVPADTRAEWRTALSPGDHGTRPGVPGGRVMLSRAGRGGPLGGARRRVRAEAGSGQGHYVGEGRRGRGDGPDVVPERPLAHIRRPVHGGLRGARGEPASRSLRGTFATIVSPNEPIRYSALPTSSSTVPSSGHTTNVTTAMSALSTAGPGEHGHEGRPHRGDVDRVHRRDTLGRRQRREPRITKVENPQKTPATSPVPRIPPRPARRTARRSSPTPPFRSTRAVARHQRSPVPR